MNLQAIGLMAAVALIANCMADVVTAHLDVEPHDGWHYIVPRIITILVAVAILVSIIYLGASVVMIE